MKFAKNLRYFAASFLMLFSTISPLGSALPRVYAEDTLPVPVTNKTIVPNGDGTYKITLSVTGKASSSQDNTKANIVVVFDSSGSMDESTTSNRYEERTYGRYGLVNNEYVQLYRWSSWQNAYVEVGNNDNHTEVYYADEASSNGYTQYSGMRYRQVAQTRLEVAKSAINGLAEKLLEYNTTTGVSDMVQMAFVDFASDVKAGTTHTTSATSAPTTSIDTFESWVNATDASGGTNWEAALTAANNVSFGDSDPTYIVFVSDGNPTFRLTSMKDSYGRSDPDDTWQTPSGVHGAGGSDNYGFNLLAAQNVAATIVTSKTLYSVGVFGDVSNMQNLNSNAIYKDAANQAALEAAFNDIVKAITNSLSLTGVTFTDGITGMTEAVIEGKAGDFTYMKGGSVWTDAPAATYDEDTKTVKWNLDETVLQDGETASISFNVYPSQESIDLVADLNNGKKSYDSLTDAQKAQIVQSGSTYSLKTNTDSPSLKYKVVQTTTVNGVPTTTISPEKEITIENPPAVGLPTDKITLQKLWEDSLDPSQREEICEDAQGNPLEVCEVVMDFYKDGQKYNPYNGEGDDQNPAIHITKESGWKLTNYISIAPGLMVAEGQASYDDVNHQVVTFNGTKYAILRTGHEYYFDEHDINSHYQLTNYRYQPMEILYDGELKLMNVKFTKDSDGKITAVESMTAMTTVSATNTIKGGINISKKVLDEDNNEITDSKDTFDIKVTLKKPDGTTAYSDTDYRIYYGENNPEYESHIVYEKDAQGNFVLDENGNKIIKYSRTDHIKETDGVIEESLYVGDTIRVVNVDTDVLYYVEESNIPKGYSLNGIDYKIKYGADGADTNDTVAKTIDGKNYYAVKGNSASSATIKNKYVSGNLSISKSVVVNSGNAATAVTQQFTFKIRLYTDNTKINELTTPYKVEGKDLYIKSGDTFTLRHNESIKLLKLPEGAYYEITEEGEYAGYTKSATGDTGVIVKNQTKTAAFTNTYAVSGKVTIKARKDLRGRSWLSDDAFIFEISNKGENQTAATIKNTSSTVHQGEMAEFEIEFSDVTVSPYTYTITENEENMRGGLTRETGDITVSIMATDNGDGTLGFTTTYAGGDTLGDDDTQNVIVNTYSSEGSIQLGATKILTGRDWQTGETYTFTVFNGNTPVSSGIVNKDNTSVTFDRITYTTEDAGKTFVYIIRETTELPDYMSNSGDITATVTVVDNNDGTMTVTVVYTDAEGNESNTIVNTYSATGDLVLKATKDLVGRDWKTGEKYYFVLKDANGVEKGRVEVTDDGEYSFEAINFTLADVGTYTYTITEEGLPANEGMTKSDDITVTVTVSDAGEGRLGFTTEYTASTITNTYQSSGSIDLKAIKDLQGRDWLSSDSFTFVLSGEGQQQTKYATMNQKTVEFDTISYTQADVANKTTYTYTISETAGYQNKSLAKSGDITATVTLVDDGKGKITASVSYTNDDTITNTYTTAGSVTLEAAKRLIGRAWGANETFTFALKQGDTVIDEKEVGQNETIEFETIQYTQPGTYTYTIVETSQLQDGMSSSGAITVTVEVEDDNAGHLTATPSYNPQDKTITNTYKASGSIQLDVTKAIDGRDWLSSDSFTFELSGGNLEEPLRATADKDHKTVRFDTISYTEADIDETYTYTISETSTMPAGMTAGDPLTVTVKITDNGNGTLTATPTYSNTDKTITNTYEANGKIKLQVTKEIEGRGWLDSDSFSFDLLQYDNVIDSKTATYDEQTVTFKELEFDQNDAGKTYVYVIEETTDLESLSMTNSGSITVTVNIIDKGNGELEVSAVYDGGTGDLNNTLVNTYTATGEAGLDVTKVLEGRKWKEGESFEFGVFDANGNKIRSGVATEDSPVIHFEEITYDQDDLLASDKYEYTIRETSELSGGFGTPNEVTATVQLSDDGKGKIYTYISYTDYDTITNTYSANGSIKLKAEKALIGRGWMDGECYSFVLKDESETKDTQSVCADGVVTFAAINYTEDDLGNTYVYTIEEDDNNLPEGVENDGKITATVTITDNDGDGVLEVVASYDHDDKITNSYETKPTTIKFQATKTIDDQSGSKKDETFVIELVDENGTVIQSKEIITEDLSGSVEFDEIEYTEVGTHTYTIREKDDGKPGFTYDKTEYKVVVEVVDDYTTAQLGTKITIDGEETDKVSVSFENIYKAKETTAKFGVKKTIEGLSEGADSSVEFEFVLAGDESGTVTITGEGSAEFDKITYKEVGTYTYTIKETDSGAGGYTYDESQFDVIVKVEDVNAELVATVTYEKDGEEVEIPEFVNTYAASGEIKLQVTKKIEGRNWLADDSFEFTLSGNGVNDTKETTSEQKTVTFDALKFTQADAGHTYTYTITETTDVDSLSMVNSGAITVNISISDNGDGTLKIDVSYSDENGNSSNTVTNSYYATGSAELEITKVLEGREWNSDDSFDFEVVDRDGNKVLSGTATKDNKTVKLGEIEYDQDDIAESKTYTYTIRETSDLTGTGFGMPNEVTATVELSDDNKGNITAIVSYTDGGEITNTYSASGDITLTAKKKLDGRDWLDGECFSFTLSDESEDIDTQSICKDGSVSFKALNFTEADINKTYTYTISETGDLPNGISNSGDITVTVKIEDNLDGTLKVTAEYTNDDTIINTYETKPTEAVFNITKTIDDRSDSERDGTFTFELVDEDTGEVIQSKPVTTSDLRGEVSFDAISYDAVGTHKYIIREKDDGQPGFTYDETEYKVVVEVVDDYAAAQLGTKITVDDEEVEKVAVTFENPYKAKETTATISVEKILEGMNEGVEAVEFTFKLTDESGNEQTTTIKPVDGVGTADFDEISYEKVGVYTYTMAEVDDQAPGYTYDDAQFTVIVTVDDINGELVATVSYEKDNETVDCASFTNTYATEDLIYGGISMTKVLEGRDLEEGEFTFEVYRDGELVTTGYNTADGEIVFEDEIVFTMPGTYSFIVKEIKNEDAEFIVFDENEYEFTIKVIDNGKGELEIDEDTSSEIVFTNKYEEPGKGENPRTNDGIMSIMMMFVLSLMGLVGSVVLGKRTLKEEK